MRIPETSTQPIVSQPKENARARLQAELLQRLVQAQDKQVEEIAREQSGKGQIVDIRC